MAAIIVVGDWVVDEYWFLVRHQSDISAHRGPDHFRASNHSEDVFMDLCGAGHVARVLYGLRSKAGSSCMLAGIGNWHMQDTDLIHHLLHGCEVAKPSFCVTHRFCDKIATEIKLISLASECGTTRVVRQYHEQESGRIQLSRVDWEPLPRTEPQKLPLNSFREKLREASGKITIVIYDLCKGVITSGLIKKLNEDYPRAHWCVRSKQVAPDWLNEIEGPLELLVIGPETAATLNPTGRWLWNREIGRPSLGILESREYSRANAIVILTKNASSAESVGGDLARSGVSARNHVAEGRFEGRIFSQ